MTAVTPVHWQTSYCSLAQSHRYIVTCSLVFSARPSPSSVLTTHLDLISFEISCWLLVIMKIFLYTWQWHHNECDGISNHQLHNYLLNCLFRCRSKKTSSSASLAFMRGIYQWPVNSLHKGPVTWKRFPFDDVIMIKRHYSNWLAIYHTSPYGSIIAAKWCHGQT